MRKPSHELEWVHKKSQITWNNEIKKQKHVTCGCNDRIYLSLAVYIVDGWKLRIFWPNHHFRLWYRVLLSVRAVPNTPNKKSGEEKKFAAMNPMAIVVRGTLDGQWRLFGVFSRLIRHAGTHLSFSSLFFNFYNHFWSEKKNQSEWMWMIKTMTATEKFSLSVGTFPLLLALPSRDGKKCVFLSLVHEETRQAAVEEENIRNLWGKKSTRSLQNKQFTRAG